MSAKCQNCGKDLIRPKADDLVRVKKMGGWITARADGRENLPWVCPDGCENALPNYGLGMELGNYKIELVPITPRKLARTVTISGSAGRGFFISEMFDKIRGDLKVAQDAMEAAEDVILRAEKEEYDI